MKIFILKNNRKIKYVLMARTEKDIDDLQEQFYAFFSRLHKSAFNVESDKYLEKFCNWLIKKHKFKLMEYEEYTD